MGKLMKLNCLNAECGQFSAKRFAGQVYAENKKCYLRTDYVSKEELQRQLDKMCKSCNDSD